MGYTRDWITSGMKKIGSGKVSKESRGPKGHRKDAGLYLKSSGSHRSI